MSSWIEGAFLPARFVQGPLSEGFLPACAYRSTPTLLLSKLYDGGNTIPLHTPQEETIMVLAVHFVVLSHLQPLTLKFSIQKSSDSNIPSSDFFALEFILMQNTLYCTHYITMMIALCSSNL
ncbi:hypothetical protein GOODEAATRI_014078 [Goodea atripinnis]|uniref:Uncharacterized protein n=1 Tax=Goodea atripinnis TaxID=208336 RepID=A0ABV0P484_9TELE